MELQSRPRRGSPKWFTRTVGPFAAGAILVPGVLSALAFVPFPYRVTVAFALPGIAAETWEDSQCGLTSNYTAPGPGVLSFNWAASNDSWGGMTLYGWVPTNSVYQDTLYQYLGPGGSANVSLTSGWEYAFEFCGLRGQTASITGDIRGNAPLLRVLQSDLSL